MTMRFFSFNTPNTNDTSKTSKGGSSSMDLREAIAYKLNGGSRYSSNVKGVENRYDSEECSHRSQVNVKRNRVIWAR